MCATRQRLASDNSRNMQSERIEMKFGEIMSLLAIATGVCLAIFICVLIYNQTQRDMKANEETPNGCVFLGHARDLNSVFFYDCNGEVIMRRVK